MSQVKESHQPVARIQSKEFSRSRIKGRATRAPVSTNTIGCKGQIDILYGTGYRRYFLHFRYVDGSAPPEDDGDDMRGACRVLQQLVIFILAELFTGGLLVTHGLEGGKSL